MIKKAITQQEIADKLNISRITVSKALRNHPDISAAMKEKIKNAVEEMGYTPNLIAKQLSLRKTFTLGIVIPDLKNSFFSYIVDSVIDTANKRNYHIILTVSREKEEIEKQNLWNLIGMRVDGLLVCISQLTSDSKIFEYVSKMNIPLVFFVRVIKGLGFSSVVYDDRIGTKIALNKIISMGYRRIAHFAGYTNINVGFERCNGYKEALEENGIQVRKDWIIEGGYELTDGIRAFEKLQSSGDLPEIILAVNDRVAMGAYEAILKAGLKIPVDIEVIGYGFNETPQLFGSKLFIIKQDPIKMGQVATNILIDEIQGKTTSRNSQILVEDNWNLS